MRHESSYGIDITMVSSFAESVENIRSELVISFTAPTDSLSFPSACPLPDKELKPGGYYLYVVPAAMHLWEMKEILYEKPYPNEEKETPYEGFAYHSIVPVEDTITLENQADIQALFGMTPYAWKTPRAGKERLSALDSLKCRIAFRIHIFQKL